MGEPMMQGLTARPPEACFILSGGGGITGSHRRCRRQPITPSNGKIYDVP
ncbi:hypothetical protein KCP71_22175 [Salmonella enterica subsp. enterica]|nr:hypothetical protein KCP71_22175 [Salmonella enterica subsp. enterica]